MILFTLRCASGHEFEGWFRDGEGFETQQKASEIACPHCGEVNARMVRTPAEMWLELHGSTSWRIPVSPPA